jgi:glutamate formiminotransferase
MLAVNVYISEGRDEATVAALKAAAASSPLSAALVHTFPDAAYNRTGFTLAGTARGGLAGAVVALADAALERVDWRKAAHAAATTHPALGVVDHVAVHPLFGAADGALAGAASLAREVAAAVGERGVPVFCYGAASPTGRTLAETRRALGYFGGGGGAGTNAEEGGTPPPLPPPEYGPRHPPPAAGVALVGATPWVVNLNVPLATGDLSVARAAARAVSTRGGGPLPGVEAMGLPHGAATEVACNLRDPSAAPPAAVEALIVAAAKAAGARVAGPAYQTGRDPGAIAGEAAAALGLEIVH